MKKITTNLPWNLMVPIFVFNINQRAILGLCTEGTCWFFSWIFLKSYYREIPSLWNIKLIDICDVRSRKSKLESRYPIVKNFFLFFQVFLASVISNRLLAYSDDSLFIFRALNLLWIASFSGATKHCGCEELGASLTTRIHAVIGKWLIPP